MKLQTSSLKLRLIVASLSTWRQATPDRAGTGSHDPFLQRDAVL